MPKKTVTDEKKRRELVNMVNTLYPFAGIEYDSTGNCKVVRYNLRPSGDVYKAENSGNKREITEFSLQSRKRLLDRVKRFDGEFGTFCTMTYPGEYETDGREVKRDLDRVLNVVRYYYRETDLNYVWWLEFQERGAPHVHISFDKPFDAILAKKLQNSWSKRFDERFGLGSRQKSDYLFSLGKVVMPVKKAGGVGRYLAKYITKERQKTVPQQYRSVGRFWGTNKDFKTRDTKTFFMKKWEFLGLLGLLGNSWGWVREIDILPANIYDVGIDFSLLRRSEIRHGGGIYSELQGSGRDDYGPNNGRFSNSGHQLNYFDARNGIPDKEA